MALLAFLGTVLLTVPVTGGRIGRLTAVRFRRAWLIAVALGLQILTISVLPPTGGWVQPALHTLSYAVATVFVASNARVPGLWMIGAGGALNAIAIAANAGVMPASPEALSAAGLAGDPGLFANSAEVAGAHLSFLGDIFAIPAPFPLHNVFSPGDLLLALGGAIAVYRICGSRIVPAGAGAFLPLMRYRGFMRLWVAQAASNFGDWAFALALAATIAERTGSVNALAVLLIVQTAPAVAMGIVGGPLLDRLSRRGIMIGTDLVRAAAVLTLVLRPDASLGHIYAIAACLGVCGALFQPAVQASLPNLVPKDRIVGANALVSLTYHLAIMAGPLVGGLLVAEFGIGPAAAFDVASFLLSVVLISGIAIERPVPEALASARAHLRDIVQGFRYVAATPLIRGLVLVIGLVMFAAAVRSPSEPLFVFGALGGEARALGSLGASWGVGMLLGSIATPALAMRWSRTHLLTLSIAAAGAAVLAASFAHALPPVMLLWLAAGAANAVGSVSYGSLLQERTPDGLRGRVCAASEATLDAVFLLGALAAGWIARHAGARGTFAAAGVFLLAVSLVSFRLLPSRARRPARTLLADALDALSPPLRRDAVG